MGALSVPGRLAVASGSGVRQNRHALVGVHRRHCMPAAATAATRRNAVATIIVRLTRLGWITVYTSADRSAEALPSGTGPERYRSNYRTD
jgi:hypothetical protein